MGLESDRLIVIAIVIVKVIVIVIVIVTVIKIVIGTVRVIVIVSGGQIPASIIYISVSGTCIQN